MMTDSEIEDLKAKFKEQGLDLEAELAKVLQGEVTRELLKELYTWEEWCALEAAIDDAKAESGYKEYFTRSEAINILNNIQADFIDDEEYEIEDYTSMNNDELESLLCTTGYVHDNDMGGIK